MKSGKLSIFGVRPKGRLRQAATKYLKEATKASIDRDAQLLSLLDPFIGELCLETVHMGTLQAFIEDRDESWLEKEDHQLRSPSCTTHPQSCRWGMDG